MVVLRGHIRASKPILLGGGKTLSIPEGCTFRFELPPGKKVLHWHQLDPPVFKRDEPDSTKHYCEAAFEVGTPVRISDGNGPGRQIGTRPFSPLDSGFWQWSYGYYRMWWTDPIGLEVNYAKAYVSWWWDGASCARKDSAGSGYADWWLTLTGWELLSRWNGEVLGGSDPNCLTYAGWTGGTHLMNQYFPPCSPFAPMYLDYDPVSASGMSDGYLYGYGTTVAWGPGLCRALLTHHNEIVRVTN